MPVKPGDILNDKLRIDALIGRGGMGQVFSATDLDTRQQVAVKVVSRLFVDETLMIRLHREATAAQRIRSDYVPRVFEVNDTGDGETYLVMERLMGEPLSARIRSQGSLPWNEVAKLGEEILRGVIDAHAAGIIHRDLKPSNVFLALRTGRVRAMVLDFGVCKMDGVDTERLTGTGESIGTVAYMAPEQIRGASKVDERADIYAFGVIVFEMLAGRLPHEGPSQMAILASKLEKESSRLRDCVRTTIPEALDAMVMRALSRDPSGRQNSAQDLLREWRSLARAEGFITGPTIPPPPAGSSKKSMPPPKGGIPRHSRDSEPPTEISKPDLSPEARAVITGPDFPAHNAGDDMAETMMALSDKGPYQQVHPSNPAYQSHPSQSMFPPQSYPTDVPVAGPPGQSAGSNRIIFGSVVAIGISLCVAVFALSRPANHARPKPVATSAAVQPMPTETSTATVTTAQLDPTPTATTTATTTADPPAASDDDAMELPSNDPAPTNASTPRKPPPPVQHRPHPPPPPPVAKDPPASTLKYTDKPRF